MNQNFVSLSLLGIAIFFVAGTAAHEAIVGGEKARVNQFPYQVSLIYYGVGHACGGGIIGDLFVLTAASCVVRLNGHISHKRLYVLAGTNDRYKTVKPAVTIEVKKIYVPMDYTPTSDHNAANIAVLKLIDRFPLPYNNYLEALRLPEYSVDNNYIDKKTTIAGWGWDNIKVKGYERNGSNTDTILRYADAVVVGQLRDRDLRRECSSRAEFCARIKQRGITTTHGTCERDIGGPLVHDGNTVIGILIKTSFNCSERNSASVYTYVPYYMRFIGLAINDTVHKSVRSLNLIPAIAYHNRVPSD